MRHRQGHRKLNITDGAHRRAMLRHIGVALIEHEQIKTTLPRAKELRRFIEPLITLGKSPSVHNRRRAFSRLQDRAAVVKLFDDLGGRFSERPGGYVRILKYGYRKGDNAPMALVELVDKAVDNADTPVDAEGSTAKASTKKASAKESAKSSNKESTSAESKADSATDTAEKSE